MWRKIISILIAVVLLCAVGAYAQTDGQYVIEMDDGAFLVDEQGSSIVERGTYGMMYVLSDLPEGVSRYAAEEKNSTTALYALLDENAQRLTDHKYMMLEYEDSAIMFIEDERMGVMDLQGNILIEPIYTYMLSCGDGSYLALRTNPYDDSADMIYKVLADGRETAAGTKVSLLGEIDEEGLCAAKSPENSKYGYIDAQGKWVIEPKFRWADGFKDGSAAAATERGTGLIDRAGKWLIEPKYDYLVREGDSLIEAGSGNSTGFIHPETFEIVASYSEENLYTLPIFGRRAGIIRDGTLQVIDENGEEIFSLENCTSLNLWEGMKDELIVLQTSQNNGDAYLYDMNGVLLAGPYQDIIPLGIGDEGMYYMFITYEATQVEYDNGMSFWDEIPSTRRCGVLNGEGKELCAFEGEYISWLGDEYILVHQLDGRIFADVQGNIVAEFENVDALMSAAGAKMAEETESENGE